MLLIFLVLGHSGGKNKYRKLWLRIMTIAFTNSAFGSLALALVYRKKVEEYRVSI